MTLGRKTGGRVKGSRNKKVFERETKLRAAIVEEVMQTMARIELGRQQIASGGGELANGPPSGPDALPRRRYFSRQGRPYTRPNQPGPSPRPAPAAEGDRRASVGQDEPSPAPAGGGEPDPKPSAGSSPLQDYLTRGNLRPLAKDELANLVPVVKTVVASFQRAAFYEDRSGAPDRKNFDAARWNRFHMWLRTFVEICGRVAEYESPKYKPIEVTPAQATMDEAERRGENEVTVVIRGGLPEPDAMVELDSEQALLKEMAAIQDRLAEVRRGRDQAGPAKPDDGMRVVE